MKKKAAILIMFFCDVLTLWLSIAVAYYLRDFLLSKEILTNVHYKNISDYIFYKPFYILFFLFIYEKIYFLHFDFWEETKRVYKAIVWSFFIIAFWMVITKDIDSFSRFVIFFSLLIYAVLLPVQKRILKRILYKNRLWCKRVELYGNKEQIKELKKEIRKNWYLGLKVVRNSDTLIIATKGMKIEDINEFLDKVGLQKKEILIIPTISDINFSDAEIFEMHNVRLNMVLLQNNLEKSSSQMIKQFMDYSLSFLMLPFLAVVFSIISVLIKADSKGPVLFKQKRFGKNGEIFECYKFRTMYIDGEDILKEYLDKNPDEVEYYKKYHKYKNDPRVTKIGRFLRKTSLDELPQIINVFKNEMSLVGPRPYMLTEKEQIGRYLNDILYVKPGITGLWQVSGRSDLDFKKRLKLDKWYIRNWSLWLDFVILLKTVKVVIDKRGAR